MPVIKFEGIDKLEKGIRENVTMSDVKRAVRHHGAKLQKKAQKNAPVDAGDLKGSIGLELSDGGLAATVEPTMEYSAYVELGTRKMKAQPYLKPAFDDQVQQFKKDLDRLVK